MEIEKGIKYFEEAIAACIEYCNSNLTEAGHSTIDIAYDIASDSSVGGTSSYNGEKYLIEINYGVLKKINDIYAILLHKNNESFYQKISLEQTFDDYKADFYLSLLVEESLKIVIFHELAHVLNGHLKYLYQNSSEKVNLNLINEDNNELEPLFSQALEMNADAFAATHCISMLTFPKSIYMRNEQCQGLIKNKSHAYLIFYIASGILFSELGMSNPRESKPLNELYYLPLRTRYDTMIRCSTNAYFKLNPEQSSDSEFLNHEFLREMSSNTELYHSMLRVKQGGSNLNFDIKNNIEEISEEYINHADEIFRYWSNTVREPLLKHTIFDLPK
ncbi:hypothetical protein [Lysinibacillus sp. NPDC086135]|uniref:hypothetical protein n=1 Tax=Lysinibacillus sp. NPDC086135 TaxID=3364130 RepID=UPI00382D5E58